MPSLSLRNSESEEGAGSGTAVWRKTLVQRGRKLISNKQSRCNNERLDGLYWHWINAERFLWHPVLITMANAPIVVINAVMLPQSRPSQPHLCSALTSVPDLCFHLITGIMRWFCTLCCEDMCTCIGKWYVSHTWKCDDFVLNFRSLERQRPIADSWHNPNFEQSRLKIDILDRQPLSETWTEIWTGIIND